MSESIQVNIDKINDLQVDSIKSLIERCKQAHFADVHIRINGKWEVHEADWIKHMEVNDG